MSSNFLRASPRGPQRPPADVARRPDLLLELGQAVEGEGAVADLGALGQAVDRGQEITACAGGGGRVVDQADEARPLAPETRHDGGKGEHGRSGHPGPGLADGGHRPVDLGQGRGPPLRGTEGGGVVDGRLEGRTGPDELGAGP
jgi:hypothetical protein